MCRQPIKLPQFFYFPILIFNVFLSDSHPLFFFLFLFSFFRYSILPKLNPKKERGCRRNLQTGFFILPEEASKQIWKAMKIQYFCVTTKGVFPCPLLSYCRFQFSPLDYRNSFFFFALLRLNPIRLNHQLSAIEWECPIRSFDECSLNCKPLRSKFRKSVLIFC